MHTAEAILLSNTLIPTKSSTNVVGMQIFTSEATLMPFNVGFMLTDLRRFLNFGFGLRF